MSGYFSDGTATVNDCFRPVSRYFDRITRPEQIIPALARTMQVLTDPAECGPVTLALCQDVQAEAYDYPEHFFEEHIWLPRRMMPDAQMSLKTPRSSRNRYIRRASPSSSSNCARFSSGTCERMSEVIGQVASQTLENMTAIAEATTRPILLPSRPVTSSPVKRISRVR